MTSPEEHQARPGRDLPSVALETRADRNALAADAGWGRFSPLGALAGALVAFGTFHTLAVLVAAAVDAADYERELASRWVGVDGATVAVVAGVAFVAFLFGGYTAGRMARRSGAVNGAAAFVTALALAVAGGLLVDQLVTEGAGDGARPVGIFGGVEAWSTAGWVAAVVVLAAMLAGALVGGGLGERWHARLLGRAMNPRVGAEAEARRLALSGAAEAEQRRVSAFARARTASPTRTTRVDREAASGRPPAPGRDRSGVPVGRFIRSRRREADERRQAGTRA